MRIIQISPSYKPAYIYGGPTQSVGKLCEAIVKVVKTKSCEIEVLTTTANGKRELNVNVNQSILIENVPVTYFNRWTKDHSHFSPKLLWHLRNVLQQAQHTNQAVIIHIHAWWNLVSVLSCLIAKWYKIPVILSPRGMLNFHTYNTGNRILKKTIHHFLGKRLLKYCVIHATTNKERTEIINFINSTSIKVISNLIEIEKESQHYNHDSQTDGIYNIIFLSRINPIKGIELLFDALSAVKAPWKLTLAGTGEENYLQNLKAKAKKLKIDPRIDWIGQVNNQNKFKLLAEHDLMILTSHNENFANAVVESLSVGTPVLISEQVGVADYVAKNDFGWITPLDSKEITRTILIALADDEKLKRIRKTAPEIVKANFNDDVLVSKYIKMYNDVIEFKLL